MKNVGFRIMRILRNAVLFPAFCLLLINCKTARESEVRDIGISEKYGKNRVVYLDEQPKVAYAMEASPVVVLRLCSLLENTSEQDVQETADKFEILYTRNERGEFEEAGKHMMSSPPPKPLIIDREVCKTEGGDERFTLKMPLEQYVEILRDKSQVDYHYVLDLEESMAQIQASVDALGQAASDEQKLQDLKTLLVEKGTLAESADLNLVKAEVFKQMALHQKELSKLDAQRAKVKELDDLLQSIRINSDGNPGKTVSSEDKLAKLALMPFDVAKEIARTNAQPKFKILKHTIDKPSREGGGEHFTLEFETPVRVRLVGLEILRWRAMIRGGIVLHFANGKKEYMFTTLPNQPLDQGFSKAHTVRNSQGEYDAVSKVTFTAEGYGPKGGKTYEGSNEVQIMLYFDAIEGAKVKLTDRRRNVLPPKKTPTIKRPYQPIRTVESYRSSYNDDSPCPGKTTFRITSNGYCQEYHKETGHVLDGNSNLDNCRRCDPTTFEINSYGYCVEKSKRTHNVLIDNSNINNCRRSDPTSFRITRKGFCEEYSKKSGNVIIANSAIDKCRESDPTEFYLNSQGFCQERSKLTKNVLLKNTNLNNCR